MSLTMALLALFLLLLAAQVGGYLFDVCKLPRVIGEIGGGLLLGPTVLGKLFPGISATLFAGTNNNLLSLISMLGLILLMTVSGFEMPGGLSGKQRKTVGILLAGATILPLIIGFSVPYVIDLSAFRGPDAGLFSFSIVLALAIAVTSIPVIARIFFDLHMLETTFARIILATATLEDIVLWGLLTVATGFATVQVVSWLAVARGIIIALIFLFVAIKILPVVLRLNFVHKINFLTRFSPLAGALLLSLALSLAAIALGLNAVFGALAAGLIIGSLGSTAFVEVRQQVRKFSMAFFIPLYFAIVGVRLNLWHGFNLGYILIFIAFAIFIKTCSVLFASRVSGFSWQSSLDFAVALNARGGPGIVLATTAYEAHIVNEQFFIILLLTALLTSLLAGVWFRHGLKVRGMNYFSEEFS